MPSQVIIMYLTFTNIKTIMWQHRSDLRLKIKQINATQFYIITKDLPSGIYQLEISTIEGLALRKFIIE